VNRLQAAFKSTDVFVIGGGPAGLAAAIALRQRGATVTVADAMHPPIDKACGEGLMPDSLLNLFQLGVHITAEDGAHFRGIRFVNGSDTATADFPLGLGIGIRRKNLHQRLIQQATETGVNLRWNTPVQLRENGQILLAGKPAQYGWLIGADGHGSPTRRWAGLEPGRILTRRFGFRQHFRIRPWSPNVEVHWGRTGQAYVTPVGPNEVCIATIARNQYSRLSTILDELPDLRARLAGGQALDSERGAMTTTRRLRHVARGRVALIGDASGSADAITGEGMGMGFRQALLLAQCLEANDLARYDSEHPAILQLPQTMARIMLLMDSSKTLRKRAIAMLAAEPEIFRHLLRVHLGTESLLKFAITRGAEVLWRLAIPAAEPDTSSPAA